MESHFRFNGWAPGLGLKKRAKTFRKWPDPLKPRKSFLSNSQLVKLWLQLRRSHLYFICISAVHIIIILQYRKPWQICHLSSTFSALPDPQISSVHRKLTLLAPTSLCKFSLLVFTYFVEGWLRELAETSRQFIFGNHFLDCRDLYVLKSTNMTRRKLMLITIGA